MILHRRDFLTSTFGAAAAIGLSRTALPAAPPNLRITDIKFLRLRFPDKMPLKRNSIIESGGGNASMTQLEIYTDQGIVGRSIASRTAIIESELLPRIRGENPFFVEGVWGRSFLSVRHAE